MKVIGNPNDWCIEVYPRRAGDFGFGSISSIKYTAEHADALQAIMKENIKRHVDDVSHIRVAYGSWLCPHGLEFGLKTEAESCDCVATV